MRRIYLSLALLEVYKLLTNDISISSGYIGRSPNSFKYCYVFLLLLLSAVLFRVNFFIHFRLNLSVPPLVRCSHTLKYSG
jgi:hypothetical protein